MLELKGVHKTYGGKVKALKNINLHVEKGEFTVLLGLSGAGKSTLLRCINGLIPVDAGSVDFEGVSALDLRNIKKIRRDIGMIFQQFNIIKRLTVMENVLCGRLAYNGTLASSLRLFKREDVEWALECIEKVGLTEKVHVRSDQLSGGQQQRVGIARALAQKPKLILADEPVASLDPYSAKEIMELLGKINQREKITSLMSLHQVGFAKEYGKRIMGINNGGIVFDQPVEGIKDEDIQLIYTGDIKPEVKKAEMQ